MNKLICSHEDQRMGRRRHGPVVTVHVHSDSVTIEMLCGKYKSNISDTDHLTGKKSP